MKIVVSPAKTLDYKRDLPTNKNTQPLFLSEAETLNTKLGNKSKKAIGQLMHVSDALAQINYERYKNFTTPFTSENARPAVYAFAGDVYIGLDAFSISENKIENLNNTLRILSGLYGILRPLDLIQPYRLEMGTALKVGRKKNLYEFWDAKITNVLNCELNDDELVLNLASQEYFKVIKPKILKAKIISPVFKDFKDGKLKLISFFAKKARGGMARYVIDTNSETLEDIKNFNYDGYNFSEEHTIKDSEPVFIR